MDGEPEPGLYIAPESFMEDLAAVKGKSNITIKINSCGGDLYTGIAIHNAIKGLTGHQGRRRGRHRGQRGQCHRLRR